jgi:bacteriocin biosynthesis cyclodehydratase domain-containing protein
MTLFPLPDHPRILVIGDGTMPEKFITLIPDCGVRLAPLPPYCTIGEIAEFAMVVLASERPFPAIEAELDEKCWHAGIPWISALLLAHEFRVGPMVVPRRTPCHECWRRRVHSQAAEPEIHTAIQNLGMSTEPGPWFTGTLAALHDQVAGILAAEVMALLSNNYPFPAGSQGRYWQGDAVYGNLESHVFSYIGTCNRCLGTEKLQAGSQALGNYARARFANSLRAAARGT